MGARLCVFPQDEETLRWVPERLTWQISPTQYLVTPLLMLMLIPIFPTKVTWAFVKDPPILMPTGIDSPIWPAFLSTNPTLGKAAILTDYQEANFTGILQLSGSLCFVLNFNYSTMPQGKALDNNC